MLNQRSIGIGKRPTKGTREGSTIWPFLIYEGSTPACSQGLSERLNQRALV